MEAVDNLQQKTTSHAFLAFTGIKTRDVKLILS